LALYAVAVSTQLSEAVRLLILRLMKVQGIKGVQLADASGLPQTSVSRKLRPNGRFDLDDIAVVAPVLGLSANELVALAERSLHSEG
jgi:DNA-binding transcriptional ArsR family regulator